METIYYSHFSDFANLNDGSAVALGMFDGVHCGHKAVIQKAIDFAHNHNLKSAVITLANHPRELTQGRAPELITSLEERLVIFAKLGLDQVLVLDFNNELMNTSAKEYLDNFLLKVLNAKFISTGYNHHFGKNREGTINFLDNWCKMHNIQLNIEEEIIANGITISSSAIRKFIKLGEIEKANQLLGHSFFLKSKIIQGDQRGTSIGFPTANLLTPNHLVIPKPGVYAGTCIVEGDENIYQCAINIGFRPSFKNNAQLAIEAHILNFKRDIYDLSLELHFKHFIRDEKKFASVTDLTTQIKQDISLITSNQNSN